MRHFIRCVTLSALLLSAAGAAYSADTYIFDPTHTTVNWNIDHFGFSKPTGKFSRVTGTLTLDETTPANSKVNVTIPIKELSTGLAELDKHLLSADFLNVAKYPTATFVSDSVEVTGKDTAQVHGALTLCGVTRPVVLDVHLNKIGDNIMKKHTAGFSATATLKRSDFGITKYSPMLGEDVPLYIESEANLPAAAAPKAQ